MYYPRIMSTEKMNAADVTLACQMESNFINGFRALASINDAKFTECDGIAEFFSGYGISWLNCVLKADGEDLAVHEKVKRVLQKYDAGCPMVWHVGALTTSPESLKSVLAKHQVRSSGHSPGMVLRKSGNVENRHVENFVVRELCRADDVQDWLRPFVEAFYLNEFVSEHFELYIRSRLGQSSRDHWFVGYLNNVPVSAASTFNDSGVSMIYNVSTIDSFRNRGYGRKVMEHVINHAMVTFGDPVGLYASELGLLLYHDLGFETVYYIEEFSFP